MLGLDNLFGMTLKSLRGDDMDIDFNDALHDLADDDSEQRKAAEEGATPTEQASTEQATAEQPEAGHDGHLAAAAGAAAAAAAVAATAAPAAAAPVEAVSAPVTTPQRGSVEEDEPTESKPANNRTRWYAGAAAALVAISTIALWPSNDDKTITATPASASAATPSPSDTPTPTPSATATTWAFSGVDPTTTTISAEQVASWCRVGPTEQVASRSSNDFYPGSVALVGPKSSRVPDRQPYPAGWRTCTLGYDKMPSGKAITFNDLRDNDAVLKKVCQDHSGFDFSTWSVINADTRRLPMAQNNNDGSVALRSPQGWIADCEVSVGAQAASLSFSEPQATTTTCPRATAVSMDKMMPPPPPMVDGKMPPPPAGMPAMPSPEEMGNMYWITAFGRVPDVNGLPAKAVKGTYQIGNGTEGNSELLIRNGFAIANHTWYLAKGDPTNTKPTLNFYDKAGTKIYSCTAS